MGLCACAEPALVMAGVVEELERAAEHKGAESPALEVVRGCSVEPQSSVRGPWARA
jgi:hypothetical protein